ncbi:MAG: metallophosphoesterase [Rhodospirillales bacterium]|nr:metallophosphoesterase [Rhodospirillales bacterium]
MFSIVHISDLHFKMDYPSLERLRALREDILSQPKESKTYLIFSGDLVDAADDNHYTVLLDEFFIYLEGELESLYLVPGNHDIQRSSTDGQQCDQLLSDPSQSYLYDNRPTIPLENPFVNADPLEHYHELQSLLSSHQELNYFGSVDQNQNFSIVCLNSTWLSYKRTDGSTDHGRLRVDPAVLQYFTRGLDGHSFSICTMHHPIEWLTNSVQRTILNHIASNFSLFLFGHVHVPNAKPILSEQGNCLFMQAPAVKSSTDSGNNAYSIINVDPESMKYEIIYRTYSESLGSFVPGVSLCPNGIQYPSTEHQIHWKDLRTGTKSGLLRRFSEKVTEVDFRDWYATNFTAKCTLVSDFIEPRLVRLVFRNGERVESPPVALRDAISQGGRRQFIMGPPDSGLTTAAYLTAKHQASRIESIGAVPVYVDLRERKIDKASIIREAVKSCPVRFSHSEMRTLVENGGVLLIFDHIGLPETDRFNGLMDTIERYFASCSTIVFCAVEGSLLDAGDPSRLQLDPLKDEVWEIEQLQILEIAALIDIYDEDASEYAKKLVLGNVVASLRQMDEPVFPSGVVLLLATLERHPEFRPINRARLLDRYVECLLGRLEVRDVTEGVFNSNDKVSFLSYVAGKFLERRASWITVEDWKELTRDYRREKLLELPSALLSEFTQRGILINQNSRVTFRADYLFRYFVAREMNSNGRVFELVTAEDNFFANHRELVFYGELEGVDNAKLLNETHSRLSRLEEKIHEKYQEEDIDLEAEWYAMLSENSISDLSLHDKTMKEVSSASPDSASVHRALSDDLEGVERGRGVNRRSSTTELEAQWFIALKTYGQLIKHCTNLEGPSKLKHLLKAARSAELFLKSMAAKRREISTNSVYYHSGVLYINPLAELDPERSVREFKFSAPASFGDVLTELMANPLLSPAFRELLREDSPVVRFLARHLLLEAANERNEEAFIRSLSEESSVVLQTCSLRKLKKKYLGYAISKEDRGYYENVIRGVGKSQSMRMQLGGDNLRRNRMLMDMKTKARKDDETEYEKNS